jgi:hypothetical protein
LMVLVGVTAAWGEPIAKEIYYQKKTALTKPATYTFKFSLWDTGDVGTGVSVWEEEKQVKVTSALIKTYLGTVTPLDPADFSEQLWVQVERKDKSGSYGVIGIRDKLTASPYSMSSLESGSLQIPASAFTPTTNTTIYNNEGGWWGTRIVLNSGTGNFVAPVQLPHGATLQRMTYYYNDSSDSDSNARLIGLNTSSFLSGPELGTMALVTSSGNGGWGLASTTAITSPVIDNINNQYNLFIELLAPNIFIYGVKFEYVY